MSERFDYAPGLPETTLRSLGDIHDTAERFTLARSSDACVSKDVILADCELAGYNRFLVVNEQDHDMQVYEQFKTYGVPQLPAVGKIHDNKQSQILFGVRTGLKLLDHEALFPRESSATYINDKEMFLQLGKLYRMAFDLTGTLMIDKDDELDNPLRHVATHSFQDGKHLLYFCPPYRYDRPQISDVRLANKLFSGLLTDALDKRTNYTLASYVTELRNEASIGFQSR